MTVRLCNSNNFRCSALFFLVLRLHFHASATQQQVSAVNQALCTASACSVEHVRVLVLALNSGNSCASMNMAGSVRISRSMPKTVTLPSSDRRTLCCCLHISFVTIHQTHTNINSLYTCALPHTTHTLHNRHTAVSSPHSSVPHILLRTFDNQRRH
jgi:hypothetical protein